MKYLLDTHILLWWLFDSPQLNPEIKKIIEEGDVFVSDISFFEIVTKRRKGKLQVEFEVNEMMEANNFQLLPLKTAHIMQSEKFSSLHGDPFDRVLVAQSVCEEMTFITHDKTLWEFPAAIVRA